MTSTSTGPSDAGATALGPINQHQEGTTDMAADLTYETPPKDRRGAKGGKWADLLAPLRERPGDWARIPGEHVNAVVTQIKRGTYKGISAGEFDATSRRVEGSEPARFRIWVRYVGHVSDSETRAAS